MTDYKRLFLDGSREKRKDKMLLGRFLRSCIFESKSLICCQPVCQLLQFCEVGTCVTDHLYRRGNGDTEGTCKLFLEITQLDNSRARTTP